MNGEYAKRKPAVILSADVKGYSLLMSEDEETTIKTLKNYREIIGRMGGANRGWVLDPPGDNVLGEFGSIDCLAFKSP